ncbi:hypothetical protein ACFQ3N_15505 [Virgibacillus byunsanensis]|uniref:Oligoendopeptidase F n=1 Tax=Virgibacillus byunsanensis TaxID=570945 RepID=A0ABW3LP37_9BACI
MQRFENYTYVRPDLNQEKEKFNDLLEAFTSANSVKEQTKAIEEINAFRNRFSTLFNLVYIRASIDTNDAFHQKERDFFDDMEPEITALNIAFYKEWMNSPYRDELEKQWGSQLFQIADYEIKGSDSMLTYRKEDQEAH